ncbi:MAG: maltose/maltodextrin ABC transporter substrate-binding protein MalE [Gammaproteobacteria bacterium]|nr:maltose/maltodextrin ABC transporter substrate-binding protein MalE [Gammaproteobacteria bacterium]
MRLSCNCRNAALALLLAFMPAALAAEQLTLWCNRGVAALQQSAARYSARTGVEVVIENPVNALVNFEIKAAAGGGPDILCWGHDRIGDWAAAGLLSAVASEAELKDLGLLPWTLPAVQVDGRFYGYPLFVEALGLIINPKLVAVPPVDLLELPQWASTLPAGVTAFAWPWLDPYFSWPLLSGGDGYLFARNARGDWLRQQPGINQPQVVRQLGWWQQQMVTGVIPKPMEAGRIRSRFARGQIAMMVEGPWSWRDLDRLGVPWQLVPWPTLGRQPVRPLVGVHVAMINAFSPRQDLAQDFLRHHLLQPQELLAWAASGELGAMAQHQAAADQRCDPRLALLLANAEQGRVMPNIAAMGRFWAVMATSLDNVANGRQSPAEALADTEARLLLL